MKKILRRTNTKEVSNDKSKNRKQNETEYLSVNVGTKMTNEESIEKENKKISTSSESELQKSSLKKGKLSKDSKNGNKAADNKKQSTNLENLKDKSTTSNEEISNEIENNKDKILLPINFEDIGVENRFDRLEKSIIEIFTPLNGVRHSLVYSLICLILIYILTIILTYTPLFINDPMLRQQYRGCNCKFNLILTITSIFCIPETILIIYYIVNYKKQIKTNFLKLLLLYSFIEVISFIIFYSILNVKFKGKIRQKLLILIFFIVEKVFVKVYIGCSVIISLLLLRTLILALCEFKRRKELELNYLKNDVEKWKENHSAVIAEYFIYKHELLNQEKKNIKK
uniref:Ion_trans domain-containing protein n=1 Tax=Strongyloides stercoralis TaxID=6248 RepID=A0A0K0EKD0_STRER